MSISPAWKAPQDRENVLEQVEERVDGESEIRKMRNDGLLGILRGKLRLDFTKYVQLESRRREHEKTFWVRKLSLDENLESDRYSNSEDESK